MPQAQRNIGTLGSQDATSVIIVGGTIDGTIIGGTTPAAGTFTTLTTDEIAALSGGSISLGSDVTLDADNRTLSFGDTDDFEIYFDNTNPRFTTASGAFIFSGGNVQSSVFNVLDYILAGSYVLKGTSGLYHISTGRWSVSAGTVAAGGAYPMIIESGDGATATGGSITLSTDGVAALTIDENQDATFSGSVNTSESIAFGTTEKTQTPTGTTATIDLGDGNHHTLDCGSATGPIDLTLTVPAGPCAGTIIIVQDASPKDITFLPSSGTVIWLGTERTWTGDANKTCIISWRWNATDLYLSATDTN
jgi:hypothetical protein